MPQFLKEITNISDLAKFFVMLLLYTGYMTWWAATVSHDIKENEEHITDHIAADRIINQQTIQLAQSVHYIQEEVEALRKSERESVRTHAKCSALMDLMIDRLEKLEQK